MSFKQIWIKLEETLYPDFSKNIFTQLLSRFYPDLLENSNYPTFIWIEFV